MPSTNKLTRADMRWWIGLAATLAAILLVNPLGYIGGGWDDWQYLTAARCWAEHGFCLPRTHWEGRWPVFVPIAGILASVGDSRVAVGIWPLVSSIAAVVLVAMIGNRAFGKPIGWLAATLLLVTPAFSIQLLDPSVEALELACIMGGVLCVLAWSDSRKASTACLAGLLFGLAFQVRETSLVAAGFAGIWVITKRPRLVDLGWAAAGFLAPLAVELLTYWMVTGDPLFRRHLSLAHTEIPTSELLGPVDHSRPPFFNETYIANWRHEPGVHLLWLIDPFLNLFINAKAGLFLLLIPLLLAVGRSEVPKEDQRRAVRLYGLALCYAAVLIYALALDPKARIMFVPLTAASLALALLVVRLWRSGKRLAAGFAVVGHFVLGLTILFIHQRTDIIEGPAAEWIASHPNQVEIDVNTRRHLALVPSAQLLPGLDSDRPYLLYNGVGRCEPWAKRVRLSGHLVEVVEEQPISRLSLFSRLGGALCLLRYRTPVSGGAARQLIQQSRDDGVYIMDPRIYLGTEPERR